jgi:hypothetical protein
VLDGDGVHRDFLPDEAVGAQVESHRLSSHHPKFTLRSRFVRMSVAHIKASLGGSVTKDTPANRLVISREFRRFATGHGVRPRHIAAAEPVVVEAVFIPTPAERYSAVIRASAARELALRSTSRISLYGERFWVRLTRLILFWKREDRFEPPT